MERKTIMNEEGEGKKNTFTDDNSDDTSKKSSSLLMMFVCMLCAQHIL